MKKLASLLWLLIVPYASDTHADSGLCEDNEINFISCLVGDKVASFCASKDLTAKNGYFQYRFGTPQKVELTYPKVKRPPTGLFFRSISPNGLENRISFKNSRYMYIFFSIDSRVGASSGIYVLKDGVLIKTLPCEPFSDQNPMPYNFITFGPFVSFEK